MKSFEGKASMRLYGQADRNFRRNEELREARME
jgi:hypothetical protein